ncbi:hypothetical protein [Flavobacterium sp. KJJ]|uniref:hypothetical protein n=1 Tax=Flavobacterium sp. KJJ TaxID=1270193 RepID=UPI0005531EB2|nr:hypothetical protein [Flavobacterium sp. KJJ]
MIRTIIRLEFGMVFPDEKQKEIIEYLKLISPESLLNIIGFSNSFPQPNYDNINSNIDIRNDIINRVHSYCENNKIKIKPCVISREGSLKLAEKILANRDLLIENVKNKIVDIDSDEINLLKSFLIINEQVNKRENFSMSKDDNIEKFSEMLITMSFSNADLGVFEGNDVELVKLIVSTLKRFELLIDFLKSDKDYEYLEISLFKYFNLENSEELINETKMLLLQLLRIKTEKNGFKFKVEDEKSKLFLNSLVSNEITEDKDFLNLRNHPLYKIDDETYSIIDYFFVVDKFYKSVRFVLKDSFNKKHDLPSNDRTFFSFYNTKFSEEYLMKHILDRVFSKKYLTKKEVKETTDNEPDYYVRHNNQVFLFENKDVLIAKEVKSSGNIETILKTFKEKFLEQKKKPIGIGQLVTTINHIVENEFKYDDYVNSKKNLTIYPILLVNDRIFEILGLNYIMNNWYLSKIKEKLRDKYNPNFIKNLIIIDIDTLIYWLPYLENNECNFKSIIDKHLSKMNNLKKPNGKTQLEIEDSVNRNIREKLSPISYRLTGYEFPSETLIEIFKDILTE